MDSSKIEKLTQFLDQYSPLIEKLADDESLPNKLRKECNELLQIKQEYKNDPGKFIAQHRYDLVLYLSAKRKLNDLYDPFHAELKNKTVTDVLQSLETNDWKAVIDDLGLINTLNKAHDSKTREKTNAIDQAEINEKVKSHDWLPEVTFDGISYMDGKNLRFTCGAEQIHVYIDKFGKVKVVTDQSDKTIVGPPTPGMQTLGEYLQSREIKIRRQLAEPPVHSQTIVSPVITNPDVASPVITNPDVASPIITNPDVNNPIIANPDLDQSNPKD
jgi:hypothetical protein